MDRYMIVIPAKNRAFNMKCDDGDSMKLETLQKLVGGPIEPVPALLSAEWAREKDVDGILLLVNEEGLMKERPLTNQRASEMTAAELVGPAVVAAKRGDELIGFAKPVVETICAEWLCGGEDEETESRADRLRNTCAGRADDTAVRAAERSADRF